MGICRFLEIIYTYSFCVGKIMYSHVWLKYTETSFSLCVREIPDQSMKGTDRTILCKVIPVQSKLTDFNSAQDCTLGGLVLVLLKRLHVLETKKIICEVESKEVKNNAHREH